MFTFNVIKKNNMEWTDRNKRIKLNYASTLIHIVMRYISELYLNLQMYTCDRNVAMRSKIRSVLQHEGLLFIISRLLFRHCCVYYTDIDGLQSTPSWLIFQTHGNHKASILYF